MKAEEGGSQNRVTFSTLSRYINVEVCVCLCRTVHVTTRTIDPEVPSRFLAVSHSKWLSATQNNQDPMS